MITTLLNAVRCSFFFFNDTATTEIYTLSLHDALPISRPHDGVRPRQEPRLLRDVPRRVAGEGQARLREVPSSVGAPEPRAVRRSCRGRRPRQPHGRSAPFARRRRDPARARQGGGPPRARGVRRRLLSRQPGQVLGGRPGRRGVGSLRSQSRPGGRVAGTEGVTGAAQPAHGQGDHVLRAGDMTTATTTIPIEIVSWVTKFVGGDGSGRRL